ncbi:6-bladed beta-propeller [Aliifodinibius salicampi]|uniref:6-bladed beta-propeller n=1 Tax=Fodinibius salicampi TaxID=1920655 RepID=A0ABT3PWM5_9BACT|nr:6-bladed beta-propeller [Fodinibius salicampi]MCW9712250.1 6-bladed beta-propeller [Fodinibius salicampi]
MRRLLGHLPSLLIVSILYVGCSSQPEVGIPDHIKKLDSLTIYSSDEPPTFDMILQRKQTFSENDTLALGTIADVAVDDSNRVFLADADQHTIHVFDADGRYITRFGREGKGPGEFIKFSRNVFTVRDSLLYVWGSELERISVFSLANFSNTATYSLVPRNFDDIDIRGIEMAMQGIDDVRAGDTFLVAFFIPPIFDFDNPGLYYFLVDKEAQFLSGNILELDAPKFFEAGSVFRHPLVAIGVDDRFFTAWTEDFLIKIYGPKGNYQQAFYYPFENTPLNEDTYLDQYTDIPSMHDRIKDMDLPPTWPALDEMLIDDQNRLWISTIVKDLDVYRWWVLEENGKLLARFTWPRNREIEVIKNGYVYTIEVNKKTGLERVVRYEINMR